MRIRDFGLNTFLKQKHKTAASTLCRDAQIPLLVHPFMAHIVLPGNHGIDEKQEIMRSGPARHHQCVATLRSRGSAGAKKSMIRRRARHTASFSAVSANIHPPLARAPHCGKQH
jgi:hypothetical protein